MRDPVPHKNFNFYIFSCVVLIWLLSPLKIITINSNFNDILSVDIHMKREFRINLLEHIPTIYFRVRAFSFAKDVREKHKGAHKALRKRSLRTNRNQKG